MDYACLRWEILAASRNTALDRSREILSLRAILLFDFAGICGAPAARPHRSLFIANYFRRIRGAGESCWAVQEIAALSNESAQPSFMKGSIIACDATILVLSRFLPRLIFPVSWPVFV